MISFNISMISFQLERENSTVVGGERLARVCNILIGYSLAVSSGQLVCLPVMLIIPPPTSETCLPGKNIEG